MKSFEITLKNDKLKQYDRIALFIIIINLALFIYLAFSVEIKSIRITAIIGLILIIIALSIDYFRSCGNVCFCMLLLSGT